jgi:hypothetical protein
VASVFLAVPPRSTAVKVALVLLSLAFLAAAGFAWREHALRVAQAAAEADAKNRLAELEKRLHAAEQHAKDLDAQLSAATSRAGTDGMDGPGESERPDGPPGGMPPGGPGGFAFREFGGRASEFMALMEDPGFVQLLNTQLRGQLDSRYAGLFKALGLNPAQIEKFKDLLVEKQTSLRDVLASARAQGLDPRQNRTEMRQLVAQANSEIDASIKSMLGDSKYTQYQQYEQTLPQRNLVAQLDQRLSYSGTPLTPTQTEQLVQILADTSPSKTTQNPMRAVRAGTTGGGTRQVAITDQAISSASGVLTPDQTKVLQTIQTEQQAQNQINQLLRESRNRPTTPKPTKPGG